ncbi:MAG: phenylalanine--tRNA ligase subunit beta [Pseudomonadota bacterium]|nr:phenylalanine--tRNA ligase subunit beta [Pseudomonadota bacterium]
MVQFNTAWLQDFLGYSSFDYKEISDKLISQGFENEVSFNFLQEGIVVGEILACDPHPQSDKLSVCLVNIGQDAPLTILCGCSTVRTGLRVAVATVGCVLGNMTIAVRNIRGLSSFGMLCSQAELGLTSSSSGIWHLSTNAPVGETLSNWLRLHNTALDVEVTMNRGGVMSLRGITREIALGMCLKSPTPPVQENLSLDQLPNAESILVHEDVADVCARFHLLELSDLDLTRQTPDWMQARLLVSGIGLHNICVDILHFVMLETGQPLHAYDADKLVTPLSVSYATQGATFCSLQGIELKLDDKTLVVKDATGSVCSIAGYMGGLATCVSNNTTRILLEAAYFCPRQLAYQCRIYKHHTHAGSRFERGVDFLNTANVLSRAAFLLKKYAGSSLSSLASFYPKPFEPCSFTYSDSIFAKILGQTVSPDLIHNMLTAIGCSTNIQTDHTIVTIPSWRHDIQLPQHLVTEYTRFFGVPIVKDDSVSAVLNNFSGNSNNNYILLDKIQSFLIAQGAFETYQYNFLDHPNNISFSENPDAILSLANPLGSTFSSLRYTLYPGLLKSLARNIAHGARDVFLYETGYCYRRNKNEVSQDKCLSFVMSGFTVPERWRDADRVYDFFEAKGVLDCILASVPLAGPLVWRATKLKGFHPGQCGCYFIADQKVAEVGTLHPSQSKNYPAQHDILLSTIYLDVLFSACAYSQNKVSSVAKTPIIRRDLSFLIPNKIKYNELYDILMKYSPTYLKSVILFDIYSGSQVPLDHYSLSIGLVFQDPNASLTDDQVSMSIDVLLKELAAVQITVRGGNHYD